MPLTFSKFYAQINEGGYDSPLTQNTVITPSVIRMVLPKVKQFIDQFNLYANKHGIPMIKMGSPLGSTAHYEYDKENKTYGDLDLQIIVPKNEAHKTPSAAQTYWWGLFDQFIKDVKPRDVSEGNSGHPIFHVSGDDYVQVDLIIHPSDTAEWGRWRTTPQHGLKGLLYGNMFSVLGDTLDMSIQHAGAQYKLKDNVRSPFRSTRGANVEVKTASASIRSFILDIFKHEAEINGVKNATPDPLLIQNPGVIAKEPKDVDIEILIKGIKGLARSFYNNDMFGKGTLSKYQNETEYLTKFFDIYKAKTDVNLSSSKRDKASEEKATSDKNTIMQGFNLVRDKFQQICNLPELPGY